MPKSIISINDTFVFHYPKTRWDASKGEDVEIPRFIFQFFLENCKRQSLYTISHHEKNFETLQNESFMPIFDSDSLFVLNVTSSFDFGPDKIGGVSYTVGPVLNSDVVEILSIDVVDEDEKTIYISMTIKGEWNWDLKTNEWNKIVNKITSSGVPFESSRISLRIDFNVNKFIYRAFPGFDKKNVEPSNQTLDNLPFVLSSIPQIFCTLHSTPPKTKAEINVKFWTILQEKNLIFGGKYLAVYNN